MFKHPSWFVVLSVAHVLSGGLLEPNILKYSSLFVSLVFIDKKTWNDSSTKRWSGYNITQSISTALEREKIGKMSFPVFGITEYAWSLYDGQRKIYEDFYTTDKNHSFHTFTLPKVVQVDRLVFVVEKGGDQRRIARPVLK